MKKQGPFVYGWETSEGKQVYVYDYGKGWGVTYDITLATRFDSINECIDHYKSKRAIPEDYIKYTIDGTLRYFHSKDKQRLLV